MKYLKIEDQKGLFWDGNEYQPIDKINKKDLLNLLNRSEGDDFEMDPYNEQLLPNKAHQIIYENLHNKLEQFLADKGQFKREVNNLYKEAIGKYSAEVTHEEEPAVEERKEDINPDDIPF
jgi:hypothetical protein